MGNQEEFESWIKKVDILLEQEFGLGSEDLPDQCYADFYEDEYSPLECFNAVVDNLRDEM